MKRSRSGVINQAEMQAYAKLLVDPCAAEFAQAPYPGMETGYYVRTKDEFTLDALSDKNSYVLLTFCPSVGYENDTATGATVGNNCILVGIGESDTASITMKKLGEGSNSPSLKKNFLQQDVVGKYRCIAACVKWVPNGPYSSRSGTVHMGYFPVNMVRDGDSIVTNNYASQSLRTSPNGSENHEIVWLPGAHDGFYTYVTGDTVAAADAYPVHGAQVFICLRNIDNENAALSAGAMSGYFEISAVWEWVPAAGFSIAAVPRTPPRFTINDVLAKYDPQKLILHNTGQFHDGHMPLTAGYKTTKRYGGARIGGGTLGYTIEDPWNEGRRPVDAERMIDTTLWTPPPPQQQLIEQRIKTTFVPTYPHAYGFGEFAAEVNYQMLHGKPIPN